MFVFAALNVVIITVAAGRSLIYVLPIIRNICVER